MPCLGFAVISVRIWSSISVNLPTNEMTEMPKQARLFRMRGCPSCINHASDNIGLQARPPAAQVSPLDNVTTVSAEDYHTTCL
jgi:hypothetical protein